MRLGAALPLTALGGGPPGPSDGGSSFGEAARVIEELGYSSLWTFDAVGRGFVLPDPLMALAAAAEVTQRIELATGILQLPIRNVVEVAHRAMTLELLAPGRVLLGVGPGSTERDFEVFGGDFATRFDTFAEQWDQLQGWIRDGKLGERDLSPWPSVLDGPTLMLAGWRGRWVERAAASGGWIASAVYADDEQLADGIGRFRAAGGGRAVVTNIQVKDDLDPTIQRLGRLADLGFDDAVVFDLTPSRDRLVALRAAVAA